MYIDGNLEDEFKDLFKQRPEAYEYNQRLELKHYEDIELNHLDRYEVCFEYKINKYKKVTDSIIQADDKVYIYNSFNSQAIVLNYLSDVIIYFEDKEGELKDAF